MSTMETTNQEIAEARGGIIINMQAILAVCEQENVRDFVQKASACLDKLCAAGSTLNSHQKALQATMNEKDAEIVRLQNKIKDKAIEDKADADAIHTLLKDHYSAVMASIPGASTTNARVERLAIENATLRETDGKLRAKITALDHENQEQHITIKNLRDEVHDFEENWETFMIEKNTAIKTLKEEKEEMLTEKNDNIMTMEEEKDAVIKALKEVNEALKKENEDLDDEKKALEEQNKVLKENGKKPMTEDDEDFKALKAENKKLEKQAEDLSAFIVDVKNIFNQFKV